MQYTQNIFESYNEMNYTYYKEESIMKKILISILTVFSLLVTPSLTLPQSQNIINIEAKAIKINKKSVTLKKGKTVQLKIFGTKKKVVWKSSNRKVASVNSKGKVTAKGKGTCTISAKVQGKILKCKITVKTTKNIGTKVYITRTGYKYHRSGCRYLSRSKIATSKSNAIKQGYTACKVCRP